MSTFQRSEEGVGDVSAGGGAVVIGHRTSLILGARVSAWHPRLGHV